MNATEVHATLKDSLRSRGDELYAGLFLLLALCLGGGPGDGTELWLGIPAFLYLITRVPLPWQGTWQTRLPWAVVALPLLQLIPLPPALFAVLPGRGALIDGLRAAGVTPQFHAFTLNAFATERALWGLLLPLSLYSAALRLDRTAQRRLLVLALLLGVVSACLGFAQAVGNVDSSLYLYEFTNRGEAVGFFANRNHLAALLVVLVPIAAGLMADRLYRARRLLDPKALAFGIGLVLMGVGVTATHSRAGFVLLIVALIAVSLLLVPGVGSGPKDRRERLLRWMRLALGIGFFLAVQFELVALLNRLEADPLDDLRWTLVRRTLDAASAYAGVGAGVGTFPDGYYRLGESVMDLGVIVNHAHNDWVELWFEGGLPAVLLALLGVGLLAVLLARRWREAVKDATESPAAESDLRPSRSWRRRHSLRGLLVGAGLTPILLALHSLVDYPLRTEALACLFALCSGILLSPREAPSPRPAERPSSKDAA